MSKRRRKLRIVLCGLGIAVLLTFLGLMVSRERFVAFGAAPDDATLARMRASPHFENGQFVDDEATTLMKVSSRESGKRWLAGDGMRVPATDGRERGRRGGHATDRRTDRADDRRDHFSVVASASADRRALSVIVTSSA